MDLITIFYQILFLFHVFFYPFNFSIKNLYRQPGYPYGELRFKRLNLIYRFILPRCKY